MGKEGLEPSRLAAHDPKSCLSANSSTSPRAEIISERGRYVNKSFINIIPTSEIRGLKPRKLMPELLE